MADITLPTPVALAGGALCLLGGYLVGVVAGPDAEGLTTGEVVSFDPDRGRLCLGGGDVEDLEQAEDGLLCGTWRSAAPSREPSPGDSFRFVTLTNENEDGEQATFIYGDVVP